MELFIWLYLRVSAPYAEGESRPVVLGQISPHLPYSNGSAWLHEVTFWSPYNDAMSLNFPVTLLLWQGYYMNSWRQCHSCNLCWLFALHGYWKMDAEWQDAADYEFLLNECFNSRLVIVCSNLHVFEGIKQSLWAKGDSSLSHVIHTLISRKTGSGIKQDTLLDSWQINSNIKEVVVALERDLMRNERWGQTTLLLIKIPVNVYLLNWVSRRKMLIK